MSTDTMDIFLFVLRAVIAIAAGWFGIGWIRLRRDARVQAAKIAELERANTSLVVERDTWWGIAMDLTARRRRLGEKAGTMPVYMLDLKDSGEEFESIVLRRMKRDLKQAMIDIRQVCPPEQRTAMRMLAIDLCNEYAAIAQMAGAAGQVDKAVTHVRARQIVMAGHCMLSQLEVMDFEIACIEDAVGTPATNRPAPGTEPTP